MGGLAKICKAYGGMTVSANGKTVKYVWDYVNDIARPEGEMTKEEFMSSEKKKYEQIKQQLKK